MEVLTWELVARIVGVFAPGFGASVRWSWPATTSANRPCLLSAPVSERAARQASRLASLTQQRVEDVLAGWLDWTAAEIPVETLPDDELLALCDLEMDEGQQQELSRLLAANREGLLDGAELVRLDELMQVYRHGLVRQARAIKVAVQRGLRLPLSSISV